MLQLYKAFYSITNYGAFDRENPCPFEEGPFDCDLIQESPNGSEADFLRSLYFLPDLSMVEYCDSAVDQIVTYGIGMGSDSDTPTSYLRLFLCRFMRHRNMPKPPYEVFQLLIGADRDRLEADLCVFREADTSSERYMEQLTAVQNWKRQKAAERARLDREEATRFRNRPLPHSPQADFIRSVAGDDV